MTEQPDIPAEPGEDLPGTGAADEPDTSVNHPLRAQDVQALTPKEIG